jgi:hypothetical protein
MIVGTNVFRPPPSTFVDGVRVLWTNTFKINAGATLRAYGDHPLLVIATATIEIDGRIDASSRTLSAGAGSNPAACNDPAFAPGAGQQCLQHGGSGGGGGGFGAAGGDGGEGGDTHACGSDGKPGGLGGKPLGVSPPALRGGCSGRAGSPNNEEGSAEGPAGKGGGAIGLIARTRITVSSVINAGGGAGQPGKLRAGGGGAGSGGMIFLESAEIDLKSTSVLAANGGGGGGGCEAGTAEAGEPGLASVDDANGGNGEGNGGDGGDGGIAGSTEGEDGETASRGGGGGGGGVGVIVINAKTAKRDGLITPAPTPAAIAGTRRDAERRAAEID